jgi:hypothetical protein
MIGALAPLPFKGRGAPERGAGASITRSRGPSGDATVKLAVARRCCPMRLFGVRSPNKFGAPLPPSDAPLWGCDRTGERSTRWSGTLHPAPGSHPSAKADGTCSALRGRGGDGVESRCFPHPPPRLPVEGGGTTSADLRALFGGWVSNKARALRPRVGLRHRVRLIDPVEF